MEKWNMPESLLKIDFAGAAKLVETSAKLVKLFTESIRDALKAGLESVDIVAARRAESRLKKMHLRATHLVRQQGIMLLPTAEKYLQLPTSANWNEVRSQIEETLKLVEPLAKDLFHEKSDFILEDTYSSLISAMKQREIALRQVLKITSPPSSKKEIDVFREFIGNYVVLLRELQQLDLALTAYVRNK